MGDTLLCKDDIIQSNKRRQSETSISSASQKSGKSELKKHVTFLPDDSLVQIHEISPRSIKSHDSDDSSDSTDSSSESDTDSETDSTSSSETSSEEGTQITRKSQIEVRPSSARPKTPSTTLKNSLASKPTIDHKTNKHFTVKLNQPTQDNKNDGGIKRSKLNLLTAAHQTLTKTRSLFTRTNSTLGVSSTVPAKIVNFENIPRRLSIPAKKRPLLPVRNAASARRRSEGSVVPPASDSALNVQALQTNETFAKLSKSLQSLTIEDAFIFPSIQTYELKLPTLKPHNSINDTQVTNHSDGRNFETSPPKSASGEQKILNHTHQGNRHSAWQMANGRAEDTLETKPNIAQLWEYSQAWSEF